LKKIPSHFSVTGLDGGGPYWYVFYWESEKGEEMLFGYLHNEDVEE